MEIDTSKYITQFGRIADPAERERAYTELMRQLGVDENHFHQELKMQNRFVQTHRDVSFARRDVALHSHDFYEILCCCNTCGMEYLVGTNRYRLQKGDIIIIKPGISHRPLFPESQPEPYCRYVLWLSREFMDRFAPMFPDFSLDRDLQTDLLRTSGTRWEYLEEMFQNGVEETENHREYWLPAVLGNTITLITHLIRAAHSASTGRFEAEKPGLVDQVMAYAEEHLAEKITLADMARVFYVSESTISQTFRRKMGVSFYRCITQRRLIAAKSLIQEGIPLEAISERVGFSDYSSFYRAFRQEYGISPREYRMAVKG